MLIINCTGILIVTGVGVALGVSVGVIVLFSVIFCLRRSATAIMGTVGSGGRSPKFGTPGHCQLPNAGTNDMHFAKKCPYLVFSKVSLFIKT